MLVDDPRAYLMPSTVEEIAFYLENTNSFDAKSQFSRLLI